MKREVYTLQKKWISTKGMTREQWLEARRAGIGGSEAAAIMGVSEYATPYTVYMDKLGLVPEKEPNEAMIQGTLIEEIVAKRFADETGCMIQKCNKMFIHPDYPWMLANIDRQVLCEEEGFVGLECKTCNAFNKTDFEGGEIRDTYYWQCQHYMAVTGAKVWYLAVMVLGTGWYTFRIERSEKDIYRLIQAESKFWNEHVLKCVPPELEGSDEEGKIINMIPVTNRDQSINLDHQQAALSRLMLAEADRDAAEKAVELAKDALKIAMGGYETATCGGYKLSWKEQKRNSIDSKKLKAELPDIAARYKKESTSRVFRYDKIKTKEA